MRTQNPNVLFFKIKMVPSCDTYNASGVILFHFSEAKPGNFLVFLGRISQLFQRLGPTFLHGRFRSKGRSYNHVDRIHCLVYFAFVLAQNLKYIPGLCNSALPAENPFRIRSGREKFCFLNRCLVISLDPIKCKGKSFQGILEPLFCWFVSFFFYSGFIFFYDFLKCFGDGPKQTGPISCRTKGMAHFISSPFNFFGSDGSGRIVWCSYGGDRFSWFNQFFWKFQDRFVDRLDGRRLWRDRANIFRSPIARGNMIVTRLVSEVRRLPTFSILVNENWIQSDSTKRTKESIANDAISQILVSELVAGHCFTKRLERCPLRHTLPSMFLKGITQDDRAVRINLFWVGNPNGMDSNQMNLKSFSHGQAFACIPFHNLMAGMWGRISAYEGGLGQKKTIK